MIQSVSPNSDAPSLDYPDIYNELIPRHGAELLSRTTSQLIPVHHGRMNLRPLARQAYEDQLNFLRYLKIQVARSGSYVRFYTAREDHGRSERRLMPTYYNNFPSNAKNGQRRL